MQQDNVHDATKRIRKTTQTIYLHVLICRSLFIVCYAKYQKTHEERTITPPRQSTRCPRGRRDGELAIGGSCRHESVIGGSFRREGEVGRNCRRNSEIGGGCRREAEIVGGCRREAEVGGGSQREAEVGGGWQRRRRSTPRASWRRDKRTSSCHIRLGPLAV